MAAGRLTHLFLRRSFSYSLTVPLVSFQDSSAGPVPTAIPRAAAVAGEQGMSPKVQLPLNV